MNGLVSTIDGRGDYVEPGFTFEINGEEWEVSEQGACKRSD